MPPVKPMLAKAVHAVPRDDGLLYEPKWDGFRCIVFRDGDELELGSRNDRPLTRYFPELVDLLQDALPARCVVDGEIVVVTDTGLGFDTLQQRLHPAASRVQKLAAETPASFVAFDLLALDDRDLTAEPFAERRRMAPRARPWPASASRAASPAGPRFDGSARQKLEPVLMSSHRGEHRRGAWGAEAPPGPPTRERPAPPCREQQVVSCGRRPHPIKLGGARRRRATTNWM
jgi:hypothetical protein